MTTFVHTFASLNCSEFLRISAYPGLSKGILKKSGKDVNGIYNQDISENVILIEVGGVDNNINEVLNTVNALSDILYTYIKG